MAYRVYVTDALKGFMGLDNRFYDVLPFEKTETNAPQETAEEVIDRIRSKLGGGKA